MRIKTIQQLTAGKSDEASENSEDFKKLKNAVVYENALAYSINRYYGEDYTFQMLKSRPNDALLNKYTALFIFKIAEARRKHLFNRYVEKPNPTTQLPTYTAFLTILDNMTLSDLEKLIVKYNPPS